MSDSNSSPVTTVTTFVALGLASAVAVSEFWPGSDAGADAATPVASSLSDADLDRLERRLIPALEERLATRFGPAATAPIGGRTESQVVTEDAIATALRSLIEKRPEVLDGLDGADAVRSEEPGTVEAFLAQIEEIGIDMDPENAESRELWAKIHEAGLTDEILAHFQSLAEAAPNDPVAQLDSARAFLAAATRDPAAAKQQWWGESDQAYARTLALDPNQWDARMEKAVTLTFWPDMFGRKSEAIGHFETLIRQAEALPADPQHADAYLLLGNLLDQQGQSDRAREIWNRGIARHPENSGLRERLGR